MSETHEGIGAQGEVEVIEPTPEQSRDERVVALTRLIVSAVTIVNIVAAAFGWQPLGIDAEQLYLGLSTIAAIAANVWSWWRNNNMTEAAQVGQMVTDRIKSGEITEGVE